MPERIMIMAEKSVKEKNWENVLTQTEKYINSGRTNQLISYFHNLALYHTGKLPYQLFDYPQNWESRRYTSHGTAIAVRVNTDILYMKT